MMKAFRIGIGSLVLVASVAFAVPFPARAAPARPAVTWSEYVKAENAKPGTPGWRITGSRAAGSSLAGYADHVSARAGEPVELYVNASGKMSASAYRIGWYAGVGARRIWTGTF